MLALGSGVVFGGVLQGALLSTLCATAASGLGFQLARTSLRTQVEDQVGAFEELIALPLGIHSYNARLKGEF